MPSTSNTSRPSKPSKPKKDDKPNQTTSNRPSPRPSAPSRPQTSSQPRPSQPSRPSSTQAQGGRDEDKRERKQRAPYSFAPVRESEEIQQLRQWKSWGEGPEEAPDRRGRQQEQPRRAYEMRSGKAERTFLPLVMQEPRGTEAQRAAPDVLRGPYEDRPRFTLEKDVTGQGPAQRPAEIQATRPLAGTTVETRPQVQRAKPDVLRGPYLSPAEEARERSRMVREEATLERTAIVPPQIARFVTQPLRTVGEFLTQTDTPQDVFIPPVAPYSNIGAGVVYPDRPKYIPPSDLRSSAVLGVEDRRARREALSTPQQSNAASYAQQQRITEAAEEQQAYLDSLNKYPPGYTPGIMEQLPGTLPALAYSTARNVWLQQRAQNPEFGQGLAQFGTGVMNFLDPLFTGLGKAVAVDPVVPLTVLPGNQVDADNHLASRIYDPELDVTYQGGWTPARLYGSVVASMNQAYLDIVEGNGGVVPNPIEYMQRVAELSRQKQLESFRRDAEIAALPVDEQAALLIARQNETSGTYDKTAEALETRDAEVARLKAEADRLAALAQQYPNAPEQYELQAALLGYQAHQLETAYASDIVEQNVNPWMEILEGLIIDPLAWMGIPFARMRKGQQIGSAVDEFSRIMTGDISDANKHAEAAMKAMFPTEAGAEAVLDLRLVPGRPQSEQAGNIITNLFKLTRKGLADQNADNAFVGVMNVLAPIPNLSVGDAKTILTAFIDDPVALVNGIPAHLFNNPILRNTPGGVVKFSPELLNPKALAQYLPMLKAAKDELLNLPFFQTEDLAAPLDKRGFVGAFNEIIMDSSARLYGVNRAGSEVPVGTWSLEVRKVDGNPNQGYYIYKDKKGNKIGQSAPDTFTDVKAERDAIQKAIRRNEHKAVTNIASAPMKFMKRIMTDWLLGPNIANWIRNGGNATFALITDGLMGFESIADQRAFLRAMYGDTMGDRRVFEAAQGGLESPIEGSRGAGVGNLYRRMMDKPLQIPYGDTAIPLPSGKEISVGEQHFYTKAFTNGTRRFWNKELPFNVDTNFTKPLLNAGLPPDVVNRIASILKDRGMGGNKIDVERAVRQAIAGASIPPSVRDVLGNAALMHTIPAETRAALETAIANFDGNFGPISKILRDWENAAARNADMAGMPTPGLRETTRQEIGRLQAQILDEFTQDAIRAGVPPEKAKAEAAAIVKEVSSTMDDVNAFMADIRSLPSSTEAASITADMWLKLYDLRSDLRAGLDDINTRVFQQHGLSEAESSAIWEQARAEKAALAKQYGDSVRQLIADERLALNNAQAVDVDAIRSRWERIYQRYQGIDEADATLRLGQEPKVAGTAYYKDTIDANRELVDKAYIELFDVIRMNPTPELFDHLAQATQTVDTISSIARSKVDAFLAQTKARSAASTDPLEQAQIWDEFYTFRNATFRKATQDTVDFLHNVRGALTGERPPRVEVPEAQLPSDFPRDPRTMTPDEYEAWATERGIPRDKTPLRPREEPPPDEFGEIPPAPTPPTTPPAPGRGSPPVVIPAGRPDLQELGRVFNAQTTKPNTTHLLNSLNAHAKEIGLDPRPGRITDLGELTPEEAQRATKWYQARAQQATREAVQPATVAATPVRVTRPPNVSSTWEGAPTRTEPFTGRPGYRPQAVPEPTTPAPESVAPITPVTPTQAGPRRPVDKVADQLDDIIGRAERHEILNASGRPTGETYFELPELLTITDETGKTITVYTSSALEAYNRRGGQQIMSEGGNRYFLASPPAPTKAPKKAKTPPERMTSDQYWKGMFESEFTPGSRTRLPQQPTLGTTTLGGNPPLTVSAVDPVALPEFRVVKEKPTRGTYETWNPLDEPPHQGANYTRRQEIEQQQSAVSTTLGDYTLVTGDFETYIINNADNTVAKFSRKERKQAQQLFKELTGTVKEKAVKPVKTIDTALAPSQVGEVERFMQAAANMPSVAPRKSSKPTPYLRALRSDKSGQNYSGVVARYPEGIDVYVALPSRNGRTEIYILRNDGVWVRYGTSYTPDGAMKEVINFTGASYDNDWAKTGFFDKTTFLKPFAWDGGTRPIDKATGDTMYGSLVPGMENLVGTFSRNLNDNLSKWWAHVSGKTEVNGTPPVPEIADVHVQDLVNAGRVREALELGLAQAGHIPNTLSPAQKLQALDALRITMDQWDRNVASAQWMAKKLADFAMLNFSRQRNLDTLASIVMPYHFFWSRSFGNWTRRMATRPELLNLYWEFEEELQRKQRQNEVWNLGIPTRFADRFQVPEGVPFFGGMFFGNPMNIVLPTNSWFANEFVDPETATNEFERGYMNLQKYTPIGSPIHNLGFGALMDWYDPRPEGAITRVQETFTPSKTFWPIQMGAYAYQGFTGNIPPTAVSGNPYMQGIVGRYAAADTTITPQEYQWALDVGLQMQAEYGPLVFQSPNAQAIWEKKAQEAGFDYTKMRMLAFATGLPWGVMAPGEQEMIQARNTRRELGYDPETNPWGSAAAVTQFDTGNQELGIRGATYSGLYPSRQEAFPSEFSPDRPGVQATRDMQQVELDAAEAKYRQATDDYYNAHIGEKSKDIKKGLDALKAQYDAEVDAITAKYAPVLKEEPVYEGAFRNHNQQEIDARAYESAKFDAIDQAGERPQKPGEGASQQEWDAYNQANEAINQKQIEILAGLLMDSNAMSRNVNGRYVTALTYEDALKTAKEMIADTSWMAPGNEKLAKRQAQERATRDAQDAEAQRRFGADILDIADGYDKNWPDDKKAAYFDKYPQLRDYWKYLEEIGVYDKKEAPVGKDGLTPEQRDAREAEAKEKFGDDIFDLWNQFSALPEGSQERKDFRNANPQLDKFWDWWFQDNKTGAATVGGTQSVWERMTPEQRAEAQAQFGANIDDLARAYGALPKNSQAREDFRASHPELLAYWDYLEKIGIYEASTSGARSLRSGPGYDSLGHRAYGSFQIGGGGGGWGWGGGGGSWTDLPQAVYQDTNFQAWRPDGRTASRSGYDRRNTNTRQLSDIPLKQLRMWR